MHHKVVRLFGKDFNRNQVEKLSFQMTFFQFNKTNFRFKYRKLQWHLNCISLYKIIYNKNIQADPLTTFIDSVQVNIDPNNLLITLGNNKLIYSSKPGAYNLSRPLEAPTNFNWNSAYGLYIQGQEFSDEKQYDSAESKLKESLALDDNFLPALVKRS